MEAIAHAAPSSLGCATARGQKTSQGSGGLHIGPPGPMARRGADGSVDQPALSTPTSAPEPYFATAAGTCHRASTWGLGWQSLCCPAGGRALPRDPSNSGCPQVPPPTTATSPTTRSPTDAALCWHHAWDGCSRPPQLPGRHIARAHRPPGPASSGCKLARRHRLLPPRPHPSRPAAGAWSCPCKRGRWFSRCRPCRGAQA